MIDNSVLEKALAISTLGTKKEVIDAALREYVETHSRKNLLELRGQIQFADNYDYKAARKGR
jgi:Arc/MetJ family transcription regulator